MSSNRLQNLLEPLIQGLGYEFVGLEYNNNPKQSVLRIYIDSNDGVGISDCEFVSREVAARMDVEDPINSQYTLEVSSPGLDRPLFTPEQFEQFKGQEAKVSLFAPHEGRRKFKGTLLGVHDGVLKMNVDGTEYELGFENIAKARLVPDYDSIMASAKK